MEELPVREIGRERPVAAAGGNEDVAAQQLPSTIPWNSIMWSTPGMMAGMISGAAGASATHGEAPSM